MNINEAKELIKKHEGLRLTPYDDGFGNLTIGYGINLSAGITKEESEMLLKNRVIVAEHDVIKIFGAKKYIRFGDVRRCAILDMMYNLGYPRFCTFKKMIAAIKKEYWSVAAKEMLDSRWAEQVGYRALELSEMLRSGKAL